jgi:hypothetical protein
VTDRFADGHAVGEVRHETSIEHVRVDREHRRVRFRRAVNRDKGAVRSDQKESVSPFWMIFF